MMKKTKKALLGAHAAAFAMKQINPDVVAAYPITPQTPIMERFAKYVADGEVDTEMILVESEHSAMSACVGASAAGARVMTATASNGLALMTEIVYIAASMRLPIVMNIANRALSGNINIHCDHSDMYLVRDSGWIQMFSENAQEVYENNLFAIRLAETYDVPVMIGQDGFVTSHALEEVEVLDDETVRQWIGERKPKHPLLDVNNPVTYGALDLFDYYFEHKVQQIQVMEQIKKDFNKLAKEFSELSGYGMYAIENYKMEDADFGIVAINSTAGIVKYVVDLLREKGIKAGAMKIRLFRPFPSKDLINILKHSNAKALAVLDRGVSFGSYGPLYLEIKNALYGKVDIKMLNYIYGLGGRDVTTDQIIKVVNDLQELLKGKELPEFNILGARL